MANEMRLIDANEPIGAFKRFAKLHPNSTWNAYGIEEVLNAAKTVDAVEVVHGRWDVEVGMNYNKERICPVCNKHIESNYWNYCPNCGAKMDGDGNVV